MEAEWVAGRRRRLLATGMLAYPAVAAAGVAQYTNAVAGYVIVGAFAVCYVFVAAARGPGPGFWPLIGVLTALFLAALPFAHENAFFLAAVVVSFAVTRMKRFATPVVVVSALATLIVPWLVWGVPGWIQTVMLVFTVLTVYAFSATIDANNALREAQAEIERLASEAERTRIARDLHDLLGHSLTAITVKSNLARRLAAKESSAALDEIAAVERLSRQALADVRAAVAGYRDVTLAGELARGRELLRAAGVTADLPTAVDVVSPAHQELFGWVVREGLTNVVRHARAGRCAVTLGAAEVEVRDDGVGSASTWGSGLAGLRERVAAAGGRLEAGPVDPRGWRVRVSFGEGT